MTEKEKEEFEKLEIDIFNTKTAWTKVYEMIGELEEIINHIEKKIELKRERLLILAGRSNILSDRKIKILEGVRERTRKENKRS